MVFNPTFELLQNQIKMKKILVPTDFSNTADKALNYAIELAICFDSELHILNSYDVPHSGSTMIINIDDLLEKDSIKNLEQCKSELKERFPDLDIYIHSISGAADDSVIRFLKNYTIDLVVMGTTGASGIKGALFGSNTSGLIKNIQTPLLVIPNQAEKEDPSRIGISTDLKFQLDDEIYNPVREIALAFGSKVSFFNINETYKKEELESIEKDFGTEIDFVYGTDLEEGINEYLIDSNINLLVLVSEKHSLVHKIFKPSVTKTMAKNLNIPMLILSQK